MADANCYEEQRTRQVEENKRKLEELRLHHLSAAVRQAAAEPMPTKRPKLRNPCVDAPTRRSNRVASLPEQPDYRDTQEYCKRKVPAGVYEANEEKVYATNEQRVYAVMKAEERRKQLDSCHGPSFVKPLTLSYVTGTTGWLPIPTQFSKRNPLLCDEMVLVDEEGMEFHVSYRVHAEQSFLAAGRNPFAICHKLEDADCLVFQLVERAKFKVYIVRASSYYEKDS